MYEDIAAPALKKYGSKQEQEMAGVISKNIKEFVMKANLTSWNRTRKPFDILDQTRDRLVYKPNEKDFNQYVLQSNDVANAFNTESESIFENGQIMAGYHKQVTAMLDGIVAKLRENPKTQKAADKIEEGWQREPSFLRVTEPIKLKPFDPTKPVTPASTPSGKAGAKQVRVRRVNQ